MTAFGTMVEDLFADPHFGEEATYRPGGAGAGLPVRIIRTVPTEELALGSTVLRAGTMALQIRAAEVVKPVKGDTVELGDGRGFKVNGAERDALGHVWSLDVAPLRT